MFNKRKALGYVVLLFILNKYVSAQQALVRSYDSPALSIGQAFLVHYGKKCLAALPNHVVTEAGIPYFLREGRDSILGEAESVENLGDDIAVALLSGRITKHCGYSITTISRAIDNILQSQGLGTLRSVNGDGTIANMAATVVDNDGQTFLRVQPSNQDIQIRKGQSGSLLMVNNQPVGMLLSVSSRYGVGKLIRLDTLLERIESHMAVASLTPDDKPSQVEDDQNLASYAQGAKIVSWSTVPTDSNHLTANLIADKKAPAWRTKVDHWPTEVEIDLADDKVVIDSILLDGQGVLKTELPKRVEILVKINPDVELWRSLMNRNVEFSEKGLATFKFAPTWARQIKIAIWETQGNRDVVSLKRIRVNGP